MVRTSLSLLFCAQLLVWVLFPLIGHHSPPLDVIEMHTWAVAPQLGYYKHPPLPAWGIYLSEALFGRNSVALFIPSALSVAGATLAVWPLARRFFGAKGGVAALYMQSTVFYYHVYSPDYNHNVAQMPFWALAVTAYYFALTDGRRRWWFAFGAALGVTTLAKYSAAFLPLACVTLLVWDARARRHVTPYNIALAAAGFFLLFGPHLVWLFAHNFAPLHYLSERHDKLATGGSWGAHFSSYVTMQIAAHLIPLGLWFSLRGGACAPTPMHFTDPNPDPVQRRMDRRFLLALGLGPFIASLMLALAGTLLHPMWATAMFPLSGLIVVLLLGARAERLARPGWAVAWVVLMLTLGGVYALKNTAMWHRISGHYPRASFPGPELAAQVDARWQTELPGRPLRTIAGTAWEAGVASFYSRYDTRVLIEADPAISPWIAADEVARCGAIVLWTKDDDLMPALRARWPGVRMLRPISLDPRRPDTFGHEWYFTALIAPAPGSAVCARH